MKLKKHLISIFFMFLLFSIFAINCQSQKPEEKETAIAETQQVNKAVTAQTKTLSYNFDECLPGSIPSGWEAAMTGKGKLGKWEVAVEKAETGKNKVLAQTSMENFGYHFDIAVAKETNFKDIALSVKFKAIKGKEDQGGGPVWRYMDENNYYICRANPLENNYRVYKVINGNRKQLKSYSLLITSNEWHTIKVEHVGTEIKCYYDGQLYLEAEDDSFTDAGKIGLWTKADSYCYFDDFTVEEK